MKKLSVISWLSVLLAVLPVHRGFAGPGAIDPTYAPGVTSLVNALAVQPNGQVVIGGNFTTVNGTSRSRIARLYADGSLDTAFLNGLSGASSTVNALVAQSDGHIVIAGNFSTVNGSTRYGVARLNANGTLDGSFVPTNYSSANFYAVAVQSDNKVIVGGNGYLFRLNADGTTDNAFFQAVSQPTIYAIAVQADGKILIGGYFTTFIGTTRNNLARLNSDGSVDGTFLNNLSGASGNVRCIQIQSDGKVLIGGDFTTVNNSSRYHIARLTSTGAVDTGFSPLNISGSSVYAMAIQPDSSIVIGGSFSDYYYNNGTSYYSYNVARLYADGTMDNTFLCPNNYFNTTYAVGLQSDGGVVVGGNFTYSSTNRYLARVYGNLYPPEFTLQPTNRTVAVGTNVIFTAHVSNPTQINFQWRKNGNDIAGATGMSYTLYNVQLGDAGTYAVFANNSIAGVTSSNAILRVGIAPAITQQPVSLVVTQGQPATFTLGASGTPLNYYWKKNGVFISGATNASLVFASTVFTNAGSYTCQVSNFLGNITSSTAALTVVAPPTILVQPVGRTVGVSSNFTVSVSANGTAPLAYQWIKDGSLLTNFVAASFTINNAQLTDSGGYSVVITNSLGSVTSSVAVITVSNFPPIIVAQPTGGNYQVGSNFSLTVTAGGSAPFAYQWNTNGVPIPGAVSASYSVTNAQTNDSGAYTVVITNLAGSITSAVALVDVGYAPVIVQQPLSITNAVGDTNGFSVTMFGSNSMLYQWFKDGLAIPNATNISLVLPNLQPTQIGFYSVSVTNAFGGTVSSNAALNLAGQPFALWQGLLAWYPFNGDATDASGNGLDGTTNGGVMFSLNRFGNTNASAAFDGSSGYVSVNDPSGGLNFDARSNSYTVTTWVRLNDTNADYTFLIDRGTTQNQPSSFTLEFVNAYNRFRASAWDGAINVSVTNLTVPVAGQWHHLAMVVENQRIRLFVNGVEESGPDSNGGVLPAGYASTKNTEGMRNIGRFAGANYANYVNGAMDEVRIYNRALSSNEVASLHAVEADLPVITQQPQSWTNIFGGSAAFSVAATAQNPLFYQWQFNGTNLVGATNATLVLTNLQYAQAGNYRVTISNALAGVISSSATLTVWQAPARLAASGLVTTNGNFGLSLSGLSGHGPIIIYASSNLLNWDAIFTNPPMVGTMQFMDGAATNWPLRFYRTAEQ